MFANFLLKLVLTMYICIHARGITALGVTALGITGVNRKKAFTMLGKSESCQTLWQTNAWVVVKNLF